MSSLPAQIQPEHASNSTTKIAPIWRFFKTSYVEIIQFVAIIVLCVVAARHYPLGFWDLLHPLFLIACLPCLARRKYVELLSRDELLEVDRPAEASSFIPSNSPTVKLTGYRLACTALTLFLAIAKFSLSADNKSAPSNYLDLAGFLVGLIFVWTGYYSEAHNTFAPWFFQKDYKPSLGKGLCELGHLCLAAILALLYFVTLDVLDVPTRSSIVRIGDQEIRHEDKVKLGTYMALSLCLWPVFLLLEGGFTWGMGSSGQPEPVYSKSTIFTTRTLTALYIFVMLRMSLLIWRHSDPQLVRHFQMIYEKVGITKLFIRTVVTEVVGVEVLESED